MDRFAQTLSCVNACFVADETLEQLPVHAQVGQTRVGGVDLNKPRLHHIAQALPALALLPEGFTASELAGQVRSQSGQTERNSTCRYQVPPQGLRTLTTLLVLRDKVIKPLLAAAGQPLAEPQAQKPTTIDQHYQTLRVVMHQLLGELGVAA